MAPQRPAPSIQPATERETLIAATALREVARGLEARWPIAATLVRRQAEKYIARQILTNHDEATRTAAGGRWCSRLWKSGPLTTPGPAHIVLPNPDARVSDKQQHTVCGKHLTGGTIEFGPHARRTDVQLPLDWQKCPDCTRGHHLAFASAA